MKIVALRERAMMDRRIIPFVHLVVMLHLEHVITPRVGTQEIAESMLTALNFRLAVVCLVAEQYFVQQTEVVNLTAQRVNHRHPHRLHHHLLPLRVLKENSYAMYVLHAMKVSLSAVVLTVAHTHAVLHNLILNVNRGVPDRAPMEHAI